MRLADGTELRAAALLFDMDGTLVDSTAVVHRLWREWAVRHGLDLDEVIRIQHGRRSHETMQHFAHLGLDVDEEAAAFLAVEREELDGIVEVPGAGALLRSLPPERWAIVTSAERRLAVARIEAAKLPMPDVLVSADDVRRGKPDPQGYLMGAQALGFDPADCIVFEDAPAGMAAGHAAGSQVVALTTSLSAAELGKERGLPDYRNVVAVMESGGVVLRVGVAPD